MLDERPGWVRVDTPPQVDGRLDDRAWHAAARVRECIQARPLEGAPATEPTDVVKYGLSSDLTLDFTYNPDFSQIESDRPQIGIHLSYGWPMGRCRARTGSCDV